MTQKKALIMVKLDPPTKDETEWHKWYDDKHIGERLAIQGFLHVRRFVKLEDPMKAFAIEGEAKYLTLYDLTTSSVLKSYEYRMLWQKEDAQPSHSFEAITRELPKLARGVYEQVYSSHDEYEPPSTKFVFVLGHDVPRDKVEEYSAWYDTEHIPAMFRVPGFLSARRFVMAKDEFPPMLGRGGTLPTYLTVYDVENQTLFESEEFLKESVSPWSTWVRSWLTRKMCALYSRIYP